MGVNCIKIRGLLFLNEIIFLVSLEGIAIDRPHNQFDRYETYIPSSCSLIP